MAAALRAPPPLPAPRPRSRARFRLPATSLETSSAAAAAAAVAVEPVGERRKKRGAVEAETGLEVLYDDGFGGATVRDYFEAARALVAGDGGGPPRWFCPAECGRPAVARAPLLLFLPGSDGVGTGLILHHKSLGKVFEVRCMHIPVDDRTPFEGLIKFVEESIKHEHASSPNRPIYLVGDSFGGCLALSVAARNPNIDLVLVLVNPATSFVKSPLQPIFPLLEALPSNLHVTVPYLLSFVMGDPVKMAMVSVGSNLPPTETLQKMSDNLTSMLPLLSELADIIPRDTLLWKLKLLKSAAAYTNSRLHAVQAEVLLLASGKDNLLPSGEEADRLFKTLKNCKVRYFRDNGHTLLLEDGVNLLSVIKGTNMYRRSRQLDFVTDYLPPTLSEFKKIFEEDNNYGVLRLAVSPVMLSTLKNGKIVRGLAGVPDKGPVLFVGYHMLMGIELFPMYEEFLREKKVLIRGMAHPLLFGGKKETSRQELSQYDVTALYGGLPVTPSNMYRLFERDSFALLYPGGVREALHRKGEEYRLFWPDQPEFVRMAARFGVTIVPFGTVGEDDLLELVLDYNDQKNIPFVREWIESFNEDNKTTRVRNTTEGEAGNQDMYVPGLLPKVPGRFYFLFGKPIETSGMNNVLRDRKSANEVYLRIKSDVENIISYLKRKREEDPYRSIAQRALYRATWGASAQVPTFEP